MPQTGLPWGSALLAQLVEHLHGKEGVDGSSPSEGFAKAPLTGFFVSDRFAHCRTWARYGALYGAFRSKTPRQSGPNAPFWAKVPRDLDKTRWCWKASATSDVFTSAPRANRLTSS
jgi:hypothetical protein